MKKIIVCGAGGFIGNHFVNRLKEHGHQVTGVDLCLPEFNQTLADQFIIGDLRDTTFCKNLFNHSYDEIYQLAADMGGAGWIFTGTNDTDILHNSAMINLNIVGELIKNPSPKIFFSSSACVYPERNQLDPANPNCKENSIYPADPDSEYGWEKIFSERLYKSLEKNHNVEVRIGRFHNIFGTECSWNNGREKSPAAICRKVAQADQNGVIDIWGDGNQTRSFLYVDECIDAVFKLMDSKFSDPINIGSEEMVSITELTQRIISISGKNLSINYVPGPTGVRGRNSDNTLIKEKLQWECKQPLNVGLEKLYLWINSQVKANCL